RRGFKHVSGLDRSRYLIRLAKRRADQRESEALSILVPHLWNESLALFTAVALHRRYAAGQKTVVPSPRHRLLKGLANGEMPPSRLLATLAKGPARPSRLRAPLRLARGVLVRDSISRLRLSRLDLKRDIVTNSVTSLIQANARACGEPVTYRGSHEWFAGLDQADISAARSKAPPSDVDDDLLRVTADAFAAGGEELPQSAAGYIRRYTADALAAIGCHVRRLEAVPERLPARLWTGAGSDPWTRMLRHVTRRFNGEVTGHDHGPGAGYTTSIQKTLIDFEACNHFITMTPGQAEGYARWVFRRDLLIQPEPPSFEARRTRWSLRRYGPVDRPVRTVMLVAGEYTAEMMRGLPLLPDPVVVDWHARLFARLRGWDYEVLFKPHPDSDGAPPPGFAALLGQAPLCEPFEAAVDRADVILFDWPRTTTFASAMLCGKPMVLVDFGLGFFVEEAQQLLRRRCAVVAGRFSDDNRCHTDWTELRAAIEQAPALMDGEFESCYFGGDL
ncbi:MAG: hypothetical protein ACFCUQ_11660, partial [Kiloniellales bacterium]